MLYIEIDRDDPIFRDPAQKIVIKYNNSLINAAWYPSAFKVAAKQYCQDYCTEHKETIMLHLLFSSPNFPDLKDILCDCYIRDILK